MNQDELADKLAAKLVKELAQKKYDVFNTLSEEKCAAENGAYLFARYLSKGSVVAAELVTLVLEYYQRTFGAIPRDIHQILENDRIGSVNQVQARNGEFLPSLTIVENLLSIHIIRAEKTEEQCAIENGAFLYERYLIDPIADQAVAAQRVALVTGYYQRMFQATAKDIYRIIESVKNGNIEHIKTEAGILLLPLTTVEDQTGIRRIKQYEIKEKKLQR